MGEIVQLASYRPKPKRSRVAPFYRTYPMPFFARASRKNNTPPSFWMVKPTGSYGKDCKKGEALAIKFLSSCDGTYGWLALLPAIVTDMIEAGPREETWPNGKPKTNGIVIGFMSVISKAAALGVAR
jgi:hypothetical protein